ncbi:twin-arginine translocation signal domain-containing protein [Halorarum salinum]|uniref:twin-arginine translocation signal domain-containing protein n=1 Tax=Halorarum salinum TaxID=2743089 RepID=UPI001C532F05|nr:twin-arginine translocation signal domain-containing protein [Halobaculum salinum]
MTRDTLLEQVVGGESRRSFLKKGTLATVGAGAAVSGAVHAQEDDAGGGGLDDEWQGLIFANDFQPNARFTFVSGVVEWTPNYGDVQDSFFADYNTRMIRWLNTGENDTLFVAEDANVGQYDEDAGFVTDADDDPNQPQLFEMNQDWTPFGDNERLINVNVSPVDEDEEDAILENEDWWLDDGADDGTETGTPGTETDGA